MVSEEEYAEWRQNPVTEWVVAAMEKQAAGIKAKWAEAAWSASEVDERTLIDAQARADCYRAIPDSEYDDWRAIYDSEY